ncbi:MAG: AsmA-like C-terminal region-containing protein [Thermoguttaceae bacterium]|nr:AsmA-like C-terminal region-containing protein [Thermoguttaceae bacterium]
MSTLSKTCTRFIKHLLEGLVLLVVLVGVVALVLMLTIDDQLSRRAETAMEVMLPGFEVSIGSATRVEGRGLLFRDVRIYAAVEQRSETDSTDDHTTSVPPRTAPELSIFSRFSLQRRQRHHPIIEVEQLQLACPTDWELLLTNQVLIDEIHLQHPILRKRHLLDGRDSVDAIIAAVSKRSGGTAIAPRKIRIEAGTIEFFDPNQYPIDPDEIGVPRWSINDVSLDLTRTPEEAAEADSDTKQNGTGTDSDAEKGSENPNASTDSGTNLSMDISKDSTEFAASTLASILPTFSTHHSPETTPPRTYAVTHTAMRPSTPPPPISTTVPMAADQISAEDDSERSVQWVRNIWRAPDDGTAPIASDPSVPNVTPPAPSSSVGNAFDSAMTQESTKPNTPVPSAAPAPNAVPTPDTTTTSATTNESESNSANAATSSTESATPPETPSRPSKWNAKLQFSTDFLKSASLEIDIDPQHGIGTLRGEILALQLTESLFNVCNLPPATQQTLSASIAGSCDLRISATLPADGALDWKLETRYQGFYRHPQCSQPFDHIDAACVLTPQQFDLQRFKAQWGAASVDCSGQSDVYTEQLQVLIAQTLQSYFPSPKPTHATSQPTEITPAAAVISASASPPVPAADTAPSLSPSDGSLAHMAFRPTMSESETPLAATDGETPTSEQTVLQQVIAYLTSGVFHFQLANLELSPELRGWLPPQQQQLWDSYQPAGMVNLQGTIQGQNGSWKPRLEATLNSFAFQDPRFPYRLHNGTGQASLTPEELSLEIVAHAENRPVSIQGHLTHPLHHPAGTFRITAEKLPIDEPMFRAIPDSVEETIRMLGLQGSFDIDSSFTYLGNGEKPQTEITLNSGDIRFCYEKFPYEINHATASATFKNAVWNVNAIGYRGNQQVIGHVQIEPEHTEANPSEPTAPNTPTSGTTPVRYCITMQINGKDVALDDELRGALPETPRRIWDDLRPRGSTNLSVAMTYHTGSKAPELQILANDWSDTTTLEPVSFPYRVDQIAGEFVYQNGSVQFRHFSAMHNSTRIQCDAEIFFSDNGSWSFAGKNLSVERLCFDSSLIQALPPSLRSTIWSLRPTGAFQLRGGPSGVSFNHTPTDDGGTSWVAKWDLFIDSQGNSLHMGIPVENIFGSVRVQGSATTGYHLSHGEMDFDSLFCKGIQLTQVRGPFMIENERISFGTAIPNITNAPLQQKIPNIIPLAGTKESQSLAGATIILPDTVQSPPPSSPDISSQATDGHLITPLPTEWNTSSSPERSELTHTAYAIPLPAPPETTTSPSGRPTIPPPPMAAQTLELAPWNHSTTGMATNGTTTPSVISSSSTPSSSSTLGIPNFPTTQTSGANPVPTNPTLANPATNTPLVTTRSNTISNTVEPSPTAVVPADATTRLRSTSTIGGSTNAVTPWNSPTSPTNTVSPYVPTFDSSALPFSMTQTNRAVTALLAGGVLNCSGSIRTGDIPVYQLTLSLRNANLAWLIGTQLEGRQSIAGQLSLDARFAGEGVSIGNLTGIGHLHLDNADIQSLPVVFSMVQKSSDSSEKQTTFHSVDVDFEMRRSQIQMKHIELCGDTLSFLGNGYWILPSEIQLAFYSLIGRPDRQIPLVGPLLGDASRRLMEIQVSGTIDQPKIETQALPVLTAAIEQFQNSLQSNRRSP